LLYRAASLILKIYVKANIIDFQLKISLLINQFVVKRREVIYVFSFYSFSHVKVYFVRFCLVK